MTRGERIYKLFDELHTNLRQSLMKRWQEVFKTKNPFDVYFFLERLNNELTLYETELKSLKVPENIYLPVVNTAKALIVNYNFSNYLEPFAMSKELLARFYGFSFYGNNEEDIEIDISNDVTTMREALENVENEELKLILTDIAETANRLQILPKISGKIGLEESFKEFYCKTKINFDEIQKAPQKYKKAIISVYTTIDNAISFAEKWLPRGEKIIDLIENMM